MPEPELVTSIEGDVWIETTKLPDGAHEFCGLWESRSLNGSPGGAYAVRSFNLTAYTKHLIRQEAMRWLKENTPEIKSSSQG